MSSPFAIPVELVRDAIAKVDCDGLLHPATAAMRDWAAMVASQLTGAPAATEAAATEAAAKGSPAQLSLEQLPIDAGERVALAAGEPVLLCLLHAEWQMQKVTSDDADWLIVTEVVDQGRHQTVEFEAARCRSLGSMAATLVHDLNNQFNSVLALSALLDGYVRDETDRAALRELERGTKAGSRMASCLARLLIRGRERQRFSSAEMLEDALSMVRKSLELAGANLQVHVAPDVPDLRGSAIEVVQSVMSGLVAMEQCRATEVRCGMTREPVAIAGGRVRDCVVLRCHAGPWNEQAMAPLLEVIAGVPGMLSRVASNPDVLESVGNATIAQRRMGGDLSAIRDGDAVQLTYVWPTAN